MTKDQSLKILELVEPITREQLEKSYRDALDVWNPDSFEGNEALKSRATCKTNEIHDAYIRLKAISELAHPFSASQSSPKSTTENRPSNSSPLTQHKSVNHPAEYFDDELITFIEGKIKSSNSGTVFLLLLLPFLGIIGIFIGIWSLRSWTRRRVFKQLLNKRSADNYFFSICVPSIWSVVWQSGLLILCLTFLCFLAQDPVFAALAGSYGAKWIVSLIFVIDVPFWILRRVKKLRAGVIHIKPSVEKNGRAQNTGLVIFVFLIFAALGYSVFRQYDEPISDYGQVMQTKASTGSNAKGTAQQLQPKNAGATSISPAAQYSSELIIPKFNVPEPYGDLAKIFEEAKLGNALAQVKIGEAYFVGKGVGLDLHEAVKWFLRAAEQGNANAQGLLGFAYFRGEGVVKDYVVASKWLHLAAEQGHTVSQTFLAINYHNGQGVPKDLVESYKWFSIAASQGATTFNDQSRSALESRMTPEQIQEAKNRAREWKENFSR